MSHSPNDSLAALRLTGYDDRVRRKLDSDGLGVAVELPTAVALAERFVLPSLREDLDVFRSGSTLLTRPVGSSHPPASVNQLELVAALARMLAALPKRADAGAPYRDLRLMAGHAASATTTLSYCRDVITAVRRKAPVWRPPATSRSSRGPAMTGAERVRAHRERARAAEVASARWWIGEYLADEPGEPGARVSAAALYELARDALEDLAHDDEPIDEDEPALLFRVPGPRTFYTVADDMLGSRRRGAKGSRAYTVPAR